MPSDITSLKVTVLICAYTFDRADDVLAAIRGCAAQRRRADETILVVDHNDELLHHLRMAVADIDPTVRIVPNVDARGLSGARSTGVSLASGDVVAFLDDDATPDPDWLGTLIVPFADPSVVGTGGTANPRWPRSAPRWFPDEFLWVVGCSYRGQPTTTTEVRNPIGCNMAFRRDDMIRVGGFATSLGRIGTRPVGCEETEMAIRLRRGDTNGPRRIVLTPDAVVHHRVSADRVRLRYFFARCHAEGMSKAVVARLQSSDLALETERTYVRRTLPSGVLRGLADPLRGRLAGPARATMILLGFIVTATGYARATLNRVESITATNGRPVPTTDSAVERRVIEKEDQRIEVDR